MLDAAVAGALEVAGLLELGLLGGPGDVEQADVGADRPVAQVGGDVADAGVDGLGGGGVAGVMPATAGASPTTW